MSNQHPQLPQSSWTEEQIKQWTRVCVTYYPSITPSAVVLKAHNKEETGWRFDKMRAVVEKEIKIYKQYLTDTQKYGKESTEKD